MESECGQRWNSAHNIGIKEDLGMEHGAPFKSDPLIHMRP